jgi:hypothetical protein
VFARGSRYETVGEAIHDNGGGRPIRFKLLRAIPGSSPGIVHAVVQGDRLDRIAFAAYGDPEQFWRICDANAAFDPDELTAQSGRRLTIPQAVT